MENSKNKDRHGKFLSVYDLSVEDVPEVFRTEERIHFIQDKCNRTVKMIVSYISRDRPHTLCDGKTKESFSDCSGNNHEARYGTGYIYHMEMYEDSPCRCMECQKSAHPVIGFMEVKVTTARHVVFDQSEAVKTKVVCFYDREDKRGVVTFHGGDLFRDSRREPDNGNVELCFYNHEKDAIDKLNERIELGISRHCDRFRFDPGFTVFHPHGGHKHISFGHSCFKVYDICRGDSPKHPGFVECRLTYPPCPQNASVSQRQEVRKDEENKIMYLKDVKMVEPGIEYLLSDISKICLPVDKVLNLRSYEGHAIPDGGGYIDSNRKFVHFPPGMEIWCIFNDPVTSFYIPTCPGSSGAPVFIDKLYTDVFFYHGVSQYYHAGLIDSKMFEYEVEQIDVMKNAATGNPLAVEECTKKENHGVFIKPEELKAEHLPEQSPTQYFFSFVKRAAQLIGKLKNPSQGGGGDCCGTGSALLDCEDESKKWLHELCVYGKLTNQQRETFFSAGEDVCYFSVMTNQHVVYDQFEAFNAVFECDFDGSHSESVHGVALKKSDIPGDYKVYLICRTTRTVYERVVSRRREVKQLANNMHFGMKEMLTRFCMVISLPHGLKNVSFGRHTTVLYGVMDDVNEDKKTIKYCDSEALIYNMKDLRKVLLYTAPTRKGSSGGLVITYSDNGRGDGSNIDLKPCYWLHNGKEKSSQLGASVMKCVHYNDGNNTSFVPESLTVVRSKLEQNSTDKVKTQPTIQEQQQQQQQKEDSKQQQQSKQQAQEMQRQLQYNQKQIEEIRKHAIEMQEQMQKNQKQIEKRKQMQDKQKQNQMLEKQKQLQIQQNEEQLERQEEQREKHKKKQDNQQPDNTAKPNFALPESDKPPLYIDMATWSARLASYKVDNYKSLCSHSHEELALGGFFFTGVKDLVRCFYCGLGLKGWKQQFDVYLEHQRERPNCGFFKMCLESEERLPNIDLIKYEEIPIPPPPKDGVMTSQHVIGLLSKEKKLLQQRKLCMMCFRKPIQELFLPCGDVCVCEKCATLVSTCPICKKDIIATASVYTA